MTNELTTAENKLVEHAKEAIERLGRIRKKRGDFDTLYSFLLSDSGTIYEGACFEPNLPQATICGEMHAISNLVFSEGYKAKIKCIVIADPVPEVQKKSTPPCGTCRSIIWQFGTPETSVIFMQYIRREKDWVFPQAEKHMIKDLYPYPYEPIEGLWG